MKTSSVGLRAPKAREKLVMSYLDALLEWLLSSEFRNPSEFLAMSFYKVVLITEYGDPIPYQLFLSGIQGNCSSRERRRLRTWRVIIAQ